MLSQSRNGKQGPKLTRNSTLAYHKMTIRLAGLEISLYYVESRLAFPMMCPILLPGQSSWYTTSGAAAWRLGCPIDSYGT